MFVAVLTMAVLLGCAFGATSVFADEATSTTVPTTTVAVTPPKIPASWLKKGVGKNIIVIGVNRHKPKHPKHWQRVVAITCDDIYASNATPTANYYYSIGMYPMTYMCVASGMTTDAVLGIIATGGNEDGSHGWTHTEMAGMQKAEACHQATASQASLASMSGGRAPLFYRARGFSFGKYVPVLQAYGLIATGAADNPKDWMKGKKSKQIEKSLEDQTRDGAIVVTHPLPETEKAMVGYRRWLRKHGYKLVTLSQLMSYGTPATRVSQLTR